MNKDILNNKDIRTVNKRELNKLEIDLSKFELLKKGETPPKSIAGLKEEAILTARKVGADLLVLSNERVYGGTFVNKYQYDYEFYKTLQR
ncbi:hypothetical protein B6U91_01610 [Candidatus Pacearchaeota archaeon ex4484_71]|nr:MAG: hypothetical protein B6U91_01610 [Candidatus Pacearchaeota archaeon ex4484_71]